MRIAICDDEQLHIDMIHKEILEFAQESKKTFNVSVYLSATDFLAATVKTKFDVIFLDISMPQINGLDLARQIRRKDIDVQIVFATCMADEMSRGFDVMAAGFIIKPITKQEIYRIFNILISHYERKNVKPYEVKLKGGQNGILMLHDIIYLESWQHYISAKTKISEFEYWGKLSDEILKLAQYGFAQFHRSYLANMAWVWLVTDEDVVFENGTSLHMGSKYAESFKNIYRKYKRGGLNS